MKLKLSWGVRIAIFFTAFVLFIIANVVFSFFHRADLVSDDYYKEELNYQETIHKSERSKRLKEDLFVWQRESILEIKFPESLKGKIINGFIRFYRPSNSSEDKNIKLSVNENNFQFIDTKLFSKGLWVLKIDWSAGDSTYYYEEKIRIN